MSTETTPNISQNIIEEINGLGEDYLLVAYDNNHTPFLAVVMILMTSIPCDIEYATVCAQQIHTLGSCEVLQGSRIHCEEVQLALGEIKVESKIFSIGANTGS